MRSEARRFTARPLTIRRSDNARRVSAVACRARVFSRGAGFLDSPIMISHPASNRDLLRSNSRDSLISTEKFSGCGCGEDLAALTPVLHDTTTFDRQRGVARPAQEIPPAHRGWITLTLPVDTIRAGLVDADLSRAIVRLVQPEVGRRHAAAELSTFGRRRSSS